MSFERPMQATSMVLRRFAYQRTFRMLIASLFLLTSVWTWAQNRDTSRDSVIFNLQPYLDATGLIATFNVNGNIDTKSAFFQSLGTNGRSCATCHVASQAFAFSAAGAKARFVNTRGRDPLFAAVDGANCPNAPQGDIASHSLVVKKGLIRIALAVPAPVSPAPAIQFTLQPVYDPYGCAIDSSSGQHVVSVYRRPLPTTNLNFLSALMFDGRESTSFPLNSSSTFAANLVADLTQQAVHATQIHAQASTDPTSDQVSAIVKFELGLTTAQVWDKAAGYLGAYSAQGGPLSLSKQPYYPGINDSLTPTIFSPTIFTLYDSWLNQTGHEFTYGKAARATIAAGEQLFNSFPIHITAVRGINDNVSLGKPATVTGTCGTCHDTPSVGNHSLPLPLDIGTGHSPAYETNAQIQAGLAELTFPDLPVYRVRGCTDPFSGETAIYTTDLGKAMLTGQCGDLNRIKGPVLRGLAARAPYFHNGAAANLSELVNFYNARFNMALTDEQKTQLVAFLNSL